MGFGLRDCCCVETVTCHCARVLQAWKWQIDLFAGAVAVPSMSRTEGLCQGSAKNCSSELTPRDVAHVLHRFTNLGLMHMLATSLLRLMMQNATSAIVVTGNSCERLSASPDHEV